MTIYQIDPIRDSRWTTFLERHPSASVFHTPGWLEALRRTYGYEPLALTTAAPGSDLQNGLAFCRVKSWLTGDRIVSVPFSDHCQPLTGTAGELQNLLSAAALRTDVGKAKYLEIRPIAMPEDAPAALRKGETFCLHQLDLTPKLDDLFKGFHKDCVQRKIRRAEREGLIYEEGTSESLLTRFYHLMVQTRKRQQMLPQPLNWFRNLIACLGEQLKIRLASKDGQSVAGILTLRHKATLVYKYGCSDARFNNLGGMPFLFWKAIQEAKNAALLNFDLGRSDWDNPGLIEFKDRWGAERTDLAYWRSGAGSDKSATSGGFYQMAKRVIGQMPNECLPLAGRLIYRHYA